MKSAQKHSTGINLLPQEEFAASTLGRILSWFLSTFRIIVIVTEIIVMGVFLSRFWLDSKANDLNEIIRARQSVLSTTTEFEKEFRVVQKKLDTFSKISNINTDSSEQMSTLTKNLPNDVYLTSIQINNELIQLKGNSLSEALISQFLLNLKEETAFADTTLMSTNTSQQNNSLIEFSLKTNISKKVDK